MALHADKGICFERLIGGGVRIFRREVVIYDTGHEDGVEDIIPKKVLVELTASQWAQAVASVSDRGTEYPGLHDEILELHQRV